MRFVARRYDRGANPVVKRIEERIARWTMLDAGQGEGFQVRLATVQHNVAIRRASAYSSLVSRQLFKPTEIYMIAIRKNTCLQMLCVG